MQLIVFLASIFVVCSSLELKNGAYDDFVIKIADTVPQQECTKIIENLETTLISASQYLFSALNSRAFLRSATILLPPAWPDSCVSTSVLSASGESSDVTVLTSDPARGKIWTQQSLGCGQPGDQIFWGYESLLDGDNTLARSLIKEFAMYRYGVFEEQGYYSDPIYPMCYYDDQTKQAKVTGCSDLPIRDNGICSADPNAVYNTTNMVDEKARSSIMFAAEAPSVSMFCDEGNHDRLAPTKHNLICQRQSVLDVILSHSDFESNSSPTLQNSNQITDTTPRIIYKKQNLTRYVFVIETTKDMMQRESWSYLRLALRQWARYILPDNTEIGMVLSDSVQSSKALNIVPARSNFDDRYGNNNRDKFYSALPYTPSESMQPGCLHCSLKEAMHMLNTRTKTHGPASNVIVVIAPGMNMEEQLNSTVEDLKRSKIKVASINYPDIVRTNTLGLLAKETGGADYTVFEQKLNVDSTLLSTYFELHNALQDIASKFYSGSQSDLPIEIHRREITDDGRSSVTGSFMLDPSMGEPARFTFYTHNTITPLIKGLKLISPSHQTYADRNDKFIDFKMITLNANISETGTWTYIVDTYTGNPQPHFLQVMATPKSPMVNVVRANFRTHRNMPGAPLILLAEVKNGDLPILGAKVEVTVTKVDANTSMLLKSKIELLDTGAGDPDITKGDGVYTRYFSAAEWGPGLYTFEVAITDNGNTAYTWTDSSKNNEDRPCCGSSITSNGVQPISPFQRVLPKITILINSEDILSASQAPVGRIGDLKVEVIPEDLKARLSWTSPDMGGTTVARYEIRYATSVLDIMDKFEISASIWDVGQPFPLAPGSETTFTLDMSQSKELLDKPLYFAIKAYPKQSSEFSGPISNWVRVLVPSPPPPPTVPPTYSSNDQGFWPSNVHNNNNVGVDPVTPSMASAMPVGMELILPVVIGIIILVILLIVYCYFCVVKKRRRDNHKNSAKANAIKKDNLNSTITIVPSSPQNNSQTYVSAEVPDPHQVGVPVNNYAYEDETKKRYSLVHQQEQQLIEELKQQQQVHQQRDTYGGVSVISNNTINRNQPILSPYNSWSASQLLHEHERRHSPMDGSMMEQEQMMTHQEMIAHQEMVAHQEMMMPHQEMMMNGEHMSVNGQSMDHMSINGHQVQEPYPQEHLPPPVPPLPAFNGNGYPVNYNIYGVHQAPPMQQGHAIYQSMQRNESLAPFNPSLQGSLNSVNSGEKKRRNVTMV